MNASTEDLFAFARSTKGAVLHTLTRRTPFTVEVIGNTLEITPGSSRQPRREDRRSVEALLKRFRESGSYQMSVYRDLTFNASYVLALLAAAERR